LVVPNGEDVLFRDLQDRDTGGRLEEAAADHGVLYGQDAPAEAVVVPETALQCAVDEESQHSACGGYLPDEMPASRADSFGFLLGAGRLKRVPGCNRAVEQGDSKNGERENSERTFSVSARNPQGCTRTQDGGLRNGESG
jgi:hypothetical protein